MNSVFVFLHHFRCAYSQIKIRKIGDNFFSAFTADTKSRVMGVIIEYFFQLFASF